jgi:hypothetical protein
MPYNKYRVSNKADRTLDGIVFASKLECSRYAFLRTLERASRITDLKLQPEFELIPKFECQGIKYRAVKYIADFEYYRFGKRVVEDVKGKVLDSYRIKRAMLLSKPHDFLFYEIKDANEIGGIELIKE